MSEEELKDLLEINCCEYHREIGKEAKKEIERLNKEIERLKEEYIILQNASEEYEDKLEKALSDIKELFDDSFYQHNEEIYSIVNKALGDKKE